MENLYDVVHITSSIVISSVAVVLLRKEGSISSLTFFFAIGIGIRPDFYLASLGEAAFAAITASGSIFAGFRNPAKPKLPASEMTPEVPLEAVDGVIDDLAERLRRVGITTCHRLANSNPLVVWARIPATLAEVVDWIGQAILINYFPDKTRDLRSMQVRTIQDCLYMLSAKNVKLKTLLVLDDDATAQLSYQIDSNSQCRNLMEIYEALVKLT